MALIHTKQIIKVNVTDDLMLRFDAADAKKLAVGRRRGSMLFYCEDGTEMHIYPEISQVAREITSRLPADL